MDHVILNPQLHLFTDESTKNSNKFIQAALKNQRELYPDPKCSAADSMHFNGQWRNRPKATPSWRRASRGSDIKDIAEDARNGFENAWDAMDGRGGEQ